MVSGQAEQVVAAQPQPKQQCEHHKKAAPHGQNQGWNLVGLGEVANKDGRCRQNGRAGQGNQVTLRSSIFVCCDGHPGIVEQLRPLPMGYLLLLNQDRSYQAFIPPLTLHTSVHFLRARLACAAPWRTRSGWCAFWLHRKQAGLRARSFAHGGSKRQYISIRTSNGSSTQAKRMGTYISVSSGFMHSFAPAAKNASYIRSTSLGSAS